MPPPGANINEYIMWMGADASGSTGVYQYLAVLGGGWQYQVYAAFSKKTTHLHLMRSDAPTLDSFGVTRRH
jgi:hypothetical protein